MAALTNLFGNGITRILGIRNLTWEDLQKFAEITKEQVTTIQYKKGGEKQPIKEPQKKQNGTTIPSTETIITGIDTVTHEDKVNKTTKEPFTIYTIHVGKQEYYTFSDTIGKNAETASQAGLRTTIEHKKTKWGQEIVNFTVEEPPEDGSAQG